MKINKTIIVDDHKIFRDGLKLALGTLPNVKVIDESPDAEDFLSKIVKALPDIVFMDISLPKMNGIDAAKKALEIMPDIKIIIMSSYNDTEIVNKAIASGIKGYLLKTADYKEIVQAINTVENGKKYFSSEIIEDISNYIQIQYKKQPENINVKLTKREIQILNALCKGDYSGLIAQELNLSDRTVEKHIQNLMRKTDTHNVSALIIFAVKNKLAKIV